MPSFQLTLPGKPPQMSPNRAADPGARKRNPQRAAFLSNKSHVNLITGQMLIMQQTLHSLIDAAAVIDIDHQNDQQCVSKVADNTIITDAIPPQAR